MDDRIEYKISFPKKDEHKSFKLSDIDGDFKGTVYLSEDGVYISLIDLRLTPSNERRRYKEVEY